MESTIRVANSDTARYLAAFQDQLDKALGNIIFSCLGTRGSDICSQMKGLFISHQRIDLAKLLVGSYEAYEIWNLIVGRYNWALQKICEIVSGRDRVKKFTKFCCLGIEGSFIHYFLGAGNYQDYKDHQIIKSLMERVKLSFFNGWLDAPYFKGLIKTLTGADDSETHILNTIN